MRKVAMVIAVLLSVTKSLNAQVDLTATGGIPAASFTTLKDAFDQVNLGFHTGSITISISGNTNETASAVLNASNSGAASYTSIVISPTGGAARTISGNLTGHLIDLNGADNVTFDGLNTGGNSLVISNTAVTQAVSAIRFRADASGNTINRCTVLGSTGNGLSTIGYGVIYFATGTVTGNDNNTISNCDIGPAGANLPINCIYSFGTSTAIDNSGMSISNNKIFNYFNTSSGSSGINVHSASSGWNITGNHFYQTALRSYAVGNIHHGISINSGSGYTISNNSIGGSTTGTGGAAYTMTDNLSTRFVGIHVSAGTTAAVNSIQGNTVANIFMNTSNGSATTEAVIVGINVASGNFDIGTVTGNTIGAATGVDNIFANIDAAALVTGIQSGTTGNVSIQNNIIGSLTSSGSTATSAGSISGINISGAAASCIISGNTIGNATANNMRGGTSGFTTGSARVSGISLPSTPATVTINGNIIQNLVSFGTGATGYVRGIHTATTATSTATGWSITGNTITNLVTNSSLAGIANGLVAAQGIHHLSSQGCVISQNNISNIANTNTTAITNIIVAGIVAANNFVSTTLGATISRNKIWGLSNTTAGTTTLSPPIVAGITILSGNNVTAITNNMISLGNAQNTRSSFIGIWLNNGTTPNPTSTNVYFNSVNIEGLSPSGGLPSFAFLRAQYISNVANTVTADIKNNIFQNTRTGGLGQHFAISNGFNATTVSATGWPANASNNNVLNANAVTIGHWTSIQNFAGWQAVSQSDTASVSGVSIPFVNAAIADLHVNFGVTPTTLESGGTPITSVSTDFDNDTRPGPAGSVNGGTFSPDIGADEFDGVHLDQVKPTISYTPLSFTCGTGNRTLTATITDRSGVPTAGAGLPVLYWRINTGAYTAVTAIHLGGSQYQFNFGAGVVNGNVVSYFIVARDNAVTPNVGAFPSAGATGFTADPPAAATPTTSPSSYNITTLLPTGTYTIGASGAYSTITAAINDYNTRCMNGPIVFELLNASYTEPGAMIITKHPDASATNTLTIKPAAGITASVNATVAGNSILRVLGNYVTIDGSNNGTTSRNLTLTNASATTPTVVHIGSTNTSPINNVTLKNCVVTNGANTGNGIVISDGAVMGNPGYFNNITIQNNDIRRALTGCLSVATVESGNGNNLLITGNLLNTSGTNAIRRTGIVVQGVNGATVSGNTIGNFERTTGENKTGVLISTGTSNTVISNNTLSDIGYSGSLTGFAPTGIHITPNLANANITVTGNTITNIFSTQGGTGVSTNGIAVGPATSDVTVTGNKISIIKNTNASGWGAHGILLNSTLTTANVNVTNNFVRAVWASGFNGNSADDNGHGITVNAGAGYNIYHNTVVLDSNQVAAVGKPAALLVTNGVTTAGAVNLRNNIFVNNQTGGSTQRYAISCMAANTVFAAIDYNNYYTDGGFNLGFIGSNRATLSDIQTGFGSNTHSLNVWPVFASPGDLHMSANANSNLESKGTPIATVTTDIDGQSRSVTIPDIGADEFAYIGVCANSSTFYVCNLGGTTFQWQLDDGTGFVNIADGAVYSGTATNILTLTTPPTSYNRYKYRCLVDGATFSDTITHKVGVTWTGAINTFWTQAGNWSCGIAPDQYTDVYINPNVPNFPVVSMNITIRSLNVTPGTTFTVGTGVIITITGQ